MAEEVVEALPKELVAKEVAALAVAPRMRLVRVTHLSAEDVLVLGKLHISQLAKWQCKDCGRINENAVPTYSL